MNVKICSRVVMDSTERRGVSWLSHSHSISPCRRVHISEATRSKLVGAFELEEGNGADRDSLLKECGVKTYLVVDRMTPRVSSRAG